MLTSSTTENINVLHSHKRASSEVCCVHCLDTCNNNNDDIDNNNNNNNSDTNNNDNIGNSSNKKERNITNK